MQLISPCRGEARLETRGRTRVEIRGDTLREKDEDHRASSCRCSISEAARNIRRRIGGIKLGRSFPASLLLSLSLIGQSPRQLRLGLVYVRRRWFHLHCNDPNRT